MGIESSVGLVVAALDLKLVRLVRAAMRGGCCPGACGPIHPTPKIEPRKRIEPEPEIEPRKRIEPTPVFEPRRRIGVGYWCDWPGNCAQIAPAECVEKVSHSPSPLEPPWKVLPWEQQPDDRARPIRKIKIVEARPDIHCKGAVIDLFI